MHLRSRLPSRYHNTAEEHSNDTPESCKQAVLPDPLLGSKGVYGDDETAKDTADQQRPPGNHAPI